MQIYDIIMLTVLLFGVIMGYRRGFAWQVASVAAIGVSYFVAINFRDVVAAKFNAEEPWNTFLAMLVLYVGTSLSIWVVFQFVKGMIDRAKLKDFDKQLGAILGAVKGALLCIVITFFAVTLLGPNQTQAIVRSRSGYYISQFLDKAKPIMPTELSQVLGPYLNKLDEGLEGAGDQETYYTNDPNESVRNERDDLGVDRSAGREDDRRFEWSIDVPFGSSLTTHKEDDSQPAEPDFDDGFDSIYSPAEDDLDYEPTASNPDPYYEVPRDRRFQGPYRR